MTAPRIVFERDTTGQVNRLRWTDARQVAVLAPVSLGSVSLAPVNVAKRGGGSDRPGR